MKSIPVLGKSTNISGKHLVVRLFTGVWTTGLSPNSFRSYVSPEFYYVHAKSKTFAIRKAKKNRILTEYQIKFLQELNSISIKKRNEVYSGCVLRSQWFNKLTVNALIKKGFLISGDDTHVVLNTPAVNWIIQNEY